MVGELGATAGSLGSILSEQEGFRGSSPGAVSGAWVTGAGVEWARGVDVGGSQHRRCASCRGEALGRCLGIGCKSYWFPIQVAASLSLIPITHPQTGQPSSFSRSHRLAHAANKPHITLSHTLVSSVSLTSLWVLPGWSPCVSLLSPGPHVGPDLTAGSHSTPDSPTPVIRT